MKRFRQIKLFTPELVDELATIVVDKDTEITQGEKSIAKYCQAKHKVITDGQNQTRVKEKMIWIQRL